MKTRNFYKKQITGLLLAAMLPILCACGGNSIFDGSRVSNADLFELDFSVLNTSYEHVFSMEEGEGIDILIEKKAGTLAVCVAGEDGTAVYRSSDAVPSAFTVFVPKKGSYRMTVEGSRAEGRVAFTRHG